MSNETKIEFQNDQRNRGTVYEAADVRLNTGLKPVENMYTLI